MIAYGMAHGLVVVAEEGYRRTMTSRVSMANVCDALDVPTLVVRDMLRELGVQLVLSA